MARYSAITSLRPETALTRAVETFGPDGHGLDIVDEDTLHVRLEHETGHVRVEVKPTGTTLTELEIETRGFDREVRQFIGDLPGESTWGRLRTLIRRLLRR